MKTQTIRIGGMTCISCQNRIEKKLKSALGVEDAEVDYPAGTARVTYNPSVIALKEIESLIESLDYWVLNGSSRSPVSELAGTLAIILALYVLFQGMGLSTLSGGFPLAEEGMGYGILLVIGLITSVHCLAMCGGINLSQCLGNKKGEVSPPLQPAERSSASPSPGGSAPKPPPSLQTSFLFPAVLYNGGRVLSYTVIGGAVGALGSVITLNGRMQGGVQLIAGVFMVIMGLNMLGLVPQLRRFIPGMPRFFTKRLDSKKQSARNPFFIGLLNGLMPCGPLQSMQLYALSTGNPLSGAASMFLFSMGTVPLMFGIGALSSLVSAQFTPRIMKAGAVLVAVLGLTMVSNGWSLGGLPDIPGLITGKLMPSPVSSTPPPEFEPVIENGVQIVQSTLSGRRYPAITVQAGIPVQWTITAPPGSIGNCNNRMIIREYGIEYRFKTGENLIEFTPTKTGRFPYSCWMGMIRSSITVVAEGASLAAAPEPDIRPRQAGVRIPLNGTAKAQVVPEGNMQDVSIALGSEGFSPAIMVVQRYIPVRWIISADSLNPGKNRLIVPAYYAQVDLEPGDNLIQFMPQGDFDFSTADNVSYGYVKVVDDLSRVDLEAIKKEVADFETLIYPEGYFDRVSQGSGGCCGGSGS